jgi:hypothetical protein
MQTGHERVGGWLLTACAAGAGLAAILAWPAVSAAESATQGAEAWRMVGYGFFAGVFLLLARTPRRLPGLFELTIAAKLALPVIALTIARGSDDALTFLIADGFVSALLVAAYLLTRDSGTRSRDQRSDGARIESGVDLPWVCGEEGGDDSERAPA